MDFWASLQHLLHGFGVATTAQNLHLRTHTFNPKQDRKGGPLATGMPEPAYYYRK